MVSPVPVIPSPLPSNTVALFVAIIEASATSVTTVGSLVVLPSLSMPSSLLSVTSLVPYELLAVTST